MMGYDMHYIYGLFMQADSYEELSDLYDRVFMIVYDYQPGVVRIH